MATRWTSARRTEVVMPNRIRIGIPMPFRLLSPLGDLLSESTIRKEGETPIPLAQASRFLFSKRTDVKWFPCQGVYVRGDFTHWKW